MANNRESGGKAAQAADCFLFVFAQTRISVLFLRLLLKGGFSWLSLQGERGFVVPRRLHKKAFSQHKQSKLVPKDAT